MYDATKLETTAGTLKFRALLSVIGYVVLGIVLGHVVSGVEDRADRISVQLSKGRYQLDPGLEADRLNQLELAFGVAFFFFGAFKAHGYFAEGNKLLCLVEQEKHLRFLSEKVRKWEASSTTSAAGPPL